MRGIRIYTDKGEYDYVISDKTTQFMAEQMFLHNYKGIKVVHSVLMPRADVRTKGRMIR